MPEELLITRTKLIVPQRRRELLRRSRLLELMSDLLDFRLIIIAAPAGYGKTSLLIDFATSFDWPVCWFALDSLDNDLQRFLSHFIYAIKEKFPDFGEEAINLLRSTPADQINLELLISVVTNDIFEKISEHFVIVLDDYHLIHSSQEIDQFLSEFIQHADDNCHVAITSRKLLTLPDLPLMVARSQVGGLSIEELAFLPDEIQALYNQVFQKDISHAQAEEIALGTEGWITGLLLNSPMLKSGVGEPIKVARASGIGLYEYLAQQVLEQQPKEIQDFLLNTSILEEFDANMCWRVIGGALSLQSEWNRIMDQVVHNNLFVLPVDGEFRWLRYHHLFRDFLQSRLLNSRPEDVEKIKLKLAEYYTENKDWEKVFDIYSSMDRTDAIADLIEKVGSSFLAKGKIAKLSSWLDRLPEKLFEKNPALLSIKASALVNQGTIQEGKELLDRAVDMLRTTKSPHQLADSLIRRSGALRMLGDYEPALKDAQLAIDITSGGKESQTLYSEALRAKGVALYQTGKLKEGLEKLTQAFEICRTSHQDEDAARILIEIGAINETLGDFTSAEKAYRQSLAYWQSIGDSMWAPTILNNLGVLLHSMGDFEGSFYNLEKSMHYSRSTGNPRMEGYALASIGDLYKDLDATMEALDAYQKSTEIAQRTGDQFLLFYLKTAIARMELLARDTSKAEMHIHTAFTIAKKSGSAYEMNKYRLEQSAFEFSRKQYKNAMENLVIAEKYFSSEGHIEEEIRTKAILILCMEKIGELDSAKQKLKEFVDTASMPSSAIPAMVTVNELKDHFKHLVLKKEFSREVSSLLSMLAEYQKQTQKSRRKIRKQASVVPFAPAKIEIRAFGKTEVIAQNKVLTISDWKTQTCRDLFFLFLAHPEGLSKEEVGVIFWPEATSAELKLRFKNAIYRMRHAIGSETVLFQDNYYQFNRSIDYEYDVQNFLAASEKSRIAKKPEEKMESLITAVDLYKGPYLPEIDATWVEPDRQKYLERFLHHIQELVRFLMETKDYTGCLTYCQKALDQDSCNEEIHRLAMQVHSLMGNKAAVSRQFELCSSFLKEEIGTLPSPQTLSLYKTLIG